MQWNDKTVHICHTRWHFFLHCLSFVFPLKHTVQIYLHEATLIENKQRKPFLYQTEGQHLACITVEEVKMSNYWIRGGGKKS